MSTRSFEVLNHNQLTCRAYGLAHTLWTFVQLRDESSSYVV